MDIVLVLEWFNVYLNGSAGAIALLVMLPALFAMLTAMRIARDTINANNKNHKIKNTVDFLDGLYKSELINAELIYISNMKGNIANMYTQTEQEDIYQHMRIVLKHFDVMAVCVSNGIYDEEIIKNAISCDVIKTWEICSSFVVEHKRREKNDSLYQVLEQLCVKWNEESWKAKKAK